MTSITTRRISSHHASVRNAFVLTILLLSGCGSSSFLLKPPLTAGCQKAGLPSCPELADGVIAYVEGDKEKAEEKIRGAVAGAAPEKVKLFINALEALDALPGSDKFMGPVHEVIAMLDGRPPGGPGSGPPPASQSGSPGGADVAPAGGGDPAFARLRTSTILVLGNPQTKSCSALAFAGGPVGPSSLCLRAAIGPLVITDLEWSSGCAAETFALAGDPELPLWFLRAEEGRAFGMHGAALVIPADAQFFVGHRLTSTAILRPSAACAVTWAGRRP